MTTKPKLITADELLLMPDDGYEYELVRGLLTEKMPPPGDGHGRCDRKIRPYIGRVL